MGLPYVWQGLKIGVGVAFQSTVTSIRHWGQVPTASRLPFCFRHDPTHYDEKVVPHEQKVHLTLSGHTHGMQFGFEIPGLRWSPVQYRYKKWAGLYETNGKYLLCKSGFWVFGLSPARRYLA